LANDYVVEAEVSAVTLQGVDDLPVRNALVRKGVKQIYDFARLTITRSQIIFYKLLGDPVELALNGV
jgi:hypothetical protein